MGTTITKDLTSTIEECYDSSFGTGSINRSQLPTLIDAVIAKAELPNNKIQYLSICDGSIKDSTISKGQIIALYNSVKSGDLELEALKKQIEYYLSDNNLRNDKFFHTQITNSQGGYISMDTLLNCKRIQSLGATPERISDAIRNSSEVEIHPENAGVRRVDNRPPPPLKIKAKQESAPEPEVAILKVTIAEENKANWKDVRDALKAKFPDTDLLYTRFAGSEGHIGMPGKQADTVIGELEIAGCTGVVSRMEEEELLQFWKDNGSHFDMCNNSLKKRKLDKNRRTLKIGGKSFASVTKLRTYLKALLSGTPEGQKVDPQYFNLLEAVLKLHPRHESKSRDLKYFEVGLHPEHPESKCFYVIRGDGSKEDFSMAKCIAQL